MSRQEIINWVRMLLGDTACSISEEECLEKYELYVQYRDEGQSVPVSLQYAGLV